MKTCSTCKQSKDESEFYKRKNGSFVASCKVCTRASNRAWAKAHPVEIYKAHAKWAAEHPEKMNEYRRKWAEEHAEEIQKKNREYAALYPEKIREASRKWRRTHPEKRLESRLKWANEHAEERRAASHKRYIENIEEHRKQGRQWAKENREKTNAYRRWRRAQAKGSSGIVSPVEWEWIKLMHDNKCANCGATGDLTQDHIVPVIKKGTNTADNIQPLCRSCNSKKHTQTIDYRSKKIKDMFGGGKDG